MLFRKKYDTSHDIAESFFECQRDGLTIRGTHYRPEGENLPIAIVSHGFSRKHDAIAMEWMREFVEEQRGKTYEEDESCR